jgi:hypothetical protein
MFIFFIKSFLRQAKHGQFLVSLCARPRRKIWGIALNWQILFMHNSSEIKFLEQIMLQIFITV